METKTINLIVVRKHAQKKIMSALTALNNTSVIATEKGNVTFETTVGRFTLELYWDHAPKTCRNFYELARRQYYTNTIFHRVVPGFCIQGGDPTGTGTGGESIYGKHMADEIHPDLKHVGAGILSMANENEPDTNGSQFFVTLAPTQFLDGKHTIFGRVKKGMNVVAKIGSVAVGRNERPLKDVKILKTFVVLDSAEDEEAEQDKGKEALPS